MPLKLSCRMRRSQDSSRGLYDCRRSSHVACAAAKTAPRRHNMCAATADKAEDDAAAHAAAEFADLKKKASFFEEALLTNPVHPGAW